MIVAAALVAALAPQRAQSQEAVAAWTRWETALNSSNSYGNPYENLLLHVSWRCLENCANSLMAPGAQLPAYGFWDGATTFKVRARFPQPSNGAPKAVWQWTTHCSLAGRSEEVDCRSDEGLQRSGTVVVARAPSDKGGSRPLYAGDLGGRIPMTEMGQLSRAGAYLAGVDGPFFWQGDTAWAASMRSKFDAGVTVSEPCTTTDWARNDWKCFINDRADKDFSVIQLAVPQYWMAEPSFVDTDGQSPFVNSADHPAWTMWNPRFWRSFEEKVRYANERGLVVLVVGVMEPSYQYLEDPVRADLRYPPFSKARTFARSIAALLAGSVVVFSPGFDTSPSDWNRIELIRRVGLELKMASSGQLVANHFGGRTPAKANRARGGYLDFCREPWLDLVLLQSGQAKSLRASNPYLQLQAITGQAYKLPIELQAAGCRKPLINAETVYDFSGALPRADKNPPAWWSNYSRYRVRQTGYLTRFSGAAGYSLGVFGLSDWGLGDSFFRPESPQAAVTAESANDIRRMGLLLRSVRWDWLAPVNLEPEMVGNPDHLRVAMARDIGRRSTLVYMPDSRRIRLHLNAELYPGVTTSRWTKRFFDPRTGQRRLAATATPIEGDAETYEISRPEVCTDGQSEGCDWVLELSETDSGAVEAQLEVWPERDEVASTWLIKGRRAANESQPEIQISARTRSVQRLPLVARGPDGAVLVVWEVTASANEGGGIYGRLIGHDGEPRTSVFRISTSEVGWHLEPAVGLDASGQYVVAWTSYSPSADATMISVRRFSPSGQPHSAEALASGSGGGVNRRSPRVATYPLRGFVVAWQEYLPSVHEWAVVAREFGPSGTPQSEVRTIERSGKEYLALERLATDDRGYAVVWQRLLAGQSRGHYRAAFDGRAGELADSRMVASKNE